MHRLSIKLKMSLWYGGLTVLLLVVFLSGSFLWLSQVMHRNLDTELLDASNEIALDLALYGPDDRYVSIEKDLSKEGLAVVMDTDYKVLFDDTGLSWSTQKPYLKNKYWSETVSGQQWRVYDAQIYNGEGKWVAIIRTFKLETKTNELLQNIAWAMAIGGLILVALALFGGYLIAKRSLAPVSKIIDTAREIEFGDLSKRIQGVETHDEVGKLASTFNSMIESLEDSFQKEKLFASNASHELRTPVAIIMNLSEQLIRKSGSGDEGSQEAHEAILAESHRMSRIISQLLTMTKGQEGEYRLDIEHIDLDETIDTVIAEVRECGSENEVDITVDGPGRHFIDADQTLITQLLLNLLENSVKYSKPDGKVVLSIQEGEESLVITVADDGIGIPEEDIPFIFDNFYRVDKSRDRSGTGLGLSIAKWIVEIHGGEISVQSELGKGSTFIVSLRKVQPDAWRSLSA